MDNGNAVNEIITIEVLDTDLLLDQNVERNSSKIASNGVRIEDSIIL